jgi:hypothetical protein
MAILALLGEAYSAFRDWRPIPAALLSHSIVLVPGPKIYPSTSSADFLADTDQERCTPDKQ